LNVLVTGGTGFIGSKLVDKLVNRGTSVTCLVRTGGISNPVVKTITGDLTYPDFILPDQEYDVVYHLAAAWPGEKDKKILKTVNYDGTVNLLSDKRQSQIHCVHFRPWGFWKSRRKRCR